MKTKDYNFILPINLLEKIDKDRIEEIKMRAEKLTYKIKLAQYDPLYRITRSYELTNATANDDLNRAEKLIFLSSILYSDEESIAFNLKKYNINSDDIIDLNRKIKCMRALNIEGELPTLNIISNISECFGIPYDYILINKLNILLVTNPEWINELDGHKRKKY